MTDNGDNTSKHPYDEVKALLARGGGTYHDITLPLPLFYRVLDYHKKQGHPIRQEWHQLIEDILNDASKGAYRARIVERIKVQEERIRDEIKRREQNPKLTYKQLYNSVLCAMQNDVDGLRRAYGITNIRRRKK